MPALTITLLEPGVTLQTHGALPDMLDANDPAPAREQLDRGYQHGFRDLSGWYLGADDVLHFPGDRPYRPIAEMRMRDERILIFEGSRSSRLIDRSKLPGWIEGRHELRICAAF